MIQTNLRAAVYCRYSSDNQTYSSIEAQLFAIEQYCKNNNIIIVERYIDAAKSATTDQRPAFQRMISDSAKKLFDVVVVHKLDRFSRNRYDSAIYQRELRRNGVTLRSVLENFDDSPESIILQSLLEGMSEYYSANLGREVMKGQRQNAIRCKHNGGSAPLGYEVDPETRKLIVNEDTAKIVRLIFSMFADGHGYSTIIKELYDRGMHTKTGRNFNKNSLHDILTNEKYRGVYIFNKSSAKGPDGKRNSHKLKDPSEVIRVEGGCPAIIDDETFEAVKKRIEENKHGYKRQAKEFYLLAGKVICKEYGKYMSGNYRIWGKHLDTLVVTYRCLTPNYLCKNREINRDYLEWKVVELLEENIFNKKSLRRIKKDIETYLDCGDDTNEEELANINLSLEKINTELQNITDVIASGIVSTALKERLVSLEEERVALTDKKANLESFHSRDTPTIDTALLLSQYEYFRLSPKSPQFKNFIQQFINKITVGNYTVYIDLKTGLDIAPALDQEFSIRREELYSWGLDKKRNGFRL
ncbi:MAG: recombinase family protein [Oscillospiraceae bacterium]|nr:recombinase family protein [Oscillospiraceae bacterium]